TDHRLPPLEPSRVAERRRIGEFPHDIIGDQRLPPRVVINERLKMSLHEIGSDGHLPSFIPSGSHLTRPSDAASGPTLCRRTFGSTYPGRFWRVIAIRVGLRRGHPPCRQRLGRVDARRITRSPRWAGLGSRVNPLVSVVLY